MLQLRAEQVAAHEADSRARFHEEVLAKLKAAFPFVTEKRDDPSLLAGVAAAHARANADWQVFGRASVTKFAAMWLLAGPDFDRTPAMAAYFRSPEDDMPTKLDRVLKQTRHELTRRADQA